jgi:hypothetical protein
VENKERRVGKNRVVSSKGRSTWKKRSSQGERGRDGVSIPPPLHYNRFFFLRKGRGDARPFFLKTANAPSGTLSGEDASNVGVGKRAKRGERGELCAS